MDLIGGPPCQAYSLAGRSRNKGKEGYRPENDHRHFLYKEYLRIISKHWPAVFVMENVKGLLSSKVEDSQIFERMLEDLVDPAKVFKNTARSYKYQLHSLTRFSKLDLFGIPRNPTTDFVIECEKYGIPQGRHRVILLGIRDDIKARPGLLIPQPHTAGVADVIDGLPRLRSGLSDGDDSREEWLKAMKKIASLPWMKEVRAKAGEEVLNTMLEHIKTLRAPRHNRGAEFIACPVSVRYRADWYLDSRIGGVCNSTTRTHIEEDIHRYFYAACFAQVHGCSPRLGDFPEALYPDQSNPLVWLFGCRVWAKAGNSPR